MELIVKAALVAKIKELIRVNELYLSEPKTDEIRFQKVGAYSVLNDLLHFINTLEVKEVDLKKEFDNYTKNILACDVQHEPFTHLYNCAKHFYELGINARKEE